MIYLCGTMVVPLAICSINFRDGLNRSDLMSDSNPRILRNRRTLARPSNSDVLICLCRRTSTILTATRVLATPQYVIHRHSRAAIQPSNSTHTLSYLSGSAIQSTEVTRLSIPECREAQAVQPPAEAISP